MEQSGGDWTNCWRRGTALGCLNHRRSLSLCKKMDLTLGMLPSLPLKNNTQSSHIQSTRNGPQHCRQSRIDDTESLHYNELWSIQYEAPAFLATPCSSQLTLWYQIVPFSPSFSIPPRYLLLLFNSCNM